MILNFHVHSLTKSQAHGLVAGAVALVSWVADNSTECVTFVKGLGLPPNAIHWILFAISTVCTLKMLAARSLKQSNSGTNTGAILDGPDTYAAQTAVSDIPGTAKQESGANPPS